MGRMFVLFLGVAFASCVFFSCKDISAPSSSASSKIVARAGDQELTMDEYVANFVSTRIIKDSLYNAKKSIESWAIESLFYQEAVEKLMSEEIQIDRQVEEYRQSLVNYIYQTKLVEANLDTLVSQEEVQSYYNDHLANFVLKDNIVKVNYLKVPLKAAGLNKIKKLIWSVKPEDKILLTELCSQNAENYFLNDSTWLFLDDLKKEIPALREQPDFNLRIGRVLEFNDDDYYYYLRIKDEKVKNGLSPLVFEINNIKKFVVNNRKTQLVSQYKQIMLEKAKAENKFITY